MRKYQFNRNEFLKIVDSAIAIQSSDTSSDLWSSTKLFNNFLKSVSPMKELQCKISRWKSLQLQYKLLLLVIVFNEQLWGNIVYLCLWLLNHKTYAITNKEFVKLLPFSDYARLFQIWSLLFQSWNFQILIKSEMKNFRSESQLRKEI